MRPLMVLPLSLVLACGPAPKPTERPLPQPVSPAALWRNFRDQRDSGQYSGRQVVISLPAGTYSPAAGGVHWWADTNRRLFAPPTVVFATRTPVTASDSTLVLVGVVRGRVSDGIRRPDGTEWYVLVGDCEVIQQPQPKEP